MTFSWRSPFRFIATMSQALWGRLKGKPFFAPHAVVELRLDTCAVCEHAVNGQCRLCDCVIDLMTVIAAKRCPDKPPRWESV